MGQGTRLSGGRGERHRAWRGGGGPAGLARSGVSWRDGLHGAARRQAQPPGGDSARHAARHQCAHELPAARCNMYFVNRRWMGGMLTNFSTVQKRIRRLSELRQMQREGRFEVLPKKEAKH